MALRRTARSRNTPAPTPGAYWRMRACSTAGRHRAKLLGSRQGQQQRLTHHDMRCGEGRTNLNCQLQLQHYSTTLHVQTLQSSCQPSTSLDLAHTTATS